MSIKPICTSFQCLVCITRIYTHTYIYKYYFLHYSMHFYLCIFSFFQKYYLNGYIKLRNKFILYCFTRVDLTLPIYILSSFPCNNEEGKSPCIREKLVNCRAKLVECYERGRSNRSSVVLPLRLHRRLQTCSSRSAFKSEVRTRHGQRMNMNGHGINMVDTWH